MRKTLIAAAAAAALAAVPATASAASIAKHDSTFLVAAQTRSLTETNVAIALLKQPGVAKSVRNLATQITRTDGHEQKFLASLAARYGVALKNDGRRRGTKQAAKLARLTGRARDRSFLRLVRSDLLSHRDVYRNEIKRGRTGRVRSQARQWISHLDRLIARTSAVLAHR
jgi:hypothetical protein